VQEFKCIHAAWDMWTLEGRQGVQDEEDAYDEKEEVVDHAWAGTASQQEAASQVRQLPNMGQVWRAEPRTGHKTCK